MLEETPDHGLDPDVVGKAGDAGPEATDTAHDELNLHALLARVVKRIDDLGIDQRIHLEPDIGRLPVLGECDFAPDMLEQRLPEVHRRSGYGLELGRPGIASDEIEDPRHVARDGGVDRKEA